MENSIMTCQSVLAQNKEMDLFTNVEDRNIVVPNTERIVKSECEESDERVLKERNGILSLFLKIFLPKSITTNPPPHREVYY